MDKEITVDLAPLNTIDLAEGLVPIEDLDYSSLYLPIMKKVFGTLSDLLEIVSIDIVLLEMISNVIAKAVKKPVKSKKVVGNQISREKALGNLSVVFIEFKDRLAVFIDRMLSFVQTRITGFGDEAEAVVLEARQQFAALGLPEVSGDCLRSFSFTIFVFATGARLVHAHQGEVVDSGELSDIVQHVEQRPRRQGPVLVARPLPQLNRALRFSKSVAHTLFVILHFCNRAAAALFGVHTFCVYTKRARRNLYFC